MIAKESGVVDEDLIEGVAEAVENQADASRDASVLDRLQMAGISNSNCPVALLCNNMAALVQLIFRHACCHSQDWQAVHDTKIQ